MSSYCQWVSLYFIRQFLGALDIAIVSASNYVATLIYTVSYIQSHGMLVHCSRTRLIISRGFTVSSISTENIIEQAQVKRD